MRFCTRFSRKGNQQSYRLLVELLEDRTLLSFIAAPSYATGSFPDCVALGDFDNDGKPDLAVVSYTRAGTVSILWGNGDGTFQTAHSYAVGSYPTSVAVGDFNGDGKLDLAVADAGTYPDPGTVTILLGNGDGTFRPALSSYTAGLRPSSLAVGDFNRDGTLDLAVVNYFSDSVSVLLGNGDGTFRAEHNYAVGHPRSVAIGDFNADGISDLAVVGGGDDGRDAIHVFLGKADGSFRPERTYAAGSSPAAVTVGDLNGDGILDLAVANNTDSTMDTVNVLLGKGDGTFGAAQTFPTGAGASALAVGDFNGDGRLDLAVADGAGVSVLLGNGDGTLQTPRIYGVGHSRSVAVGDLDRDGHLDLAVANYDSGTVSVLLGAGDGTFRAQASYPAGLSPVSVAMGHFGGSDLDLVVANSGDRDGGIAIPSDLSVFLSAGKGAFQAAVAYADYSYPQSVAVGDFNGDGHDDLVVAGGFGVSVWLGNGDGTFQEPRVIYAGGFCRSVAVGDFDGDGTPDLAVAESDRVTGQGGLIVLLNIGDGRFGAPQSYAAGPRPSSLAVADFDGDGALDLAVASQGAYPDYKSTVTILPGNGDGTFRRGQSYVVGAGLRGPCLAGGDFDGHGTPDLAVVNFGTSPDYQGTVSILLGNGDGTFQAAQSYAAGPYASCVAVGDFNADGSLDLAVGSNSGVGILLGNGDGTFQVTQNYAAGGYPTSIVARDFDGNGYPDLAVADYSSNTVTVLLNAADWGGRPPHGPAPIPYHRPFTTHRGQLSVATLLEAPKPETVCALTPICSDLAPSARGQWPWKTETSHAADHQGRSQRQQMRLNRQDFDPKARDLIDCVAKARQLLDFGRMLVQTPRGAGQRPAEELSSF